MSEQNNWDTLCRIRFDFLQGNINKDEAVNALENGLHWIRFRCERMVSVWQDLRWKQVPEKEKDGVK